MGLTDLLHVAYAGLLSMGLRFTATDQTVETTRRRVAEGICWVACEGAAFVGTICGYRPDPEDPVSYYRQPEVAHFGQFGVDPSRQGKGIGKALLKAVEDWARTQGYREIALDTSDGAAHLIDLYERWGFNLVDTHDWRPGTNYTSVVMAKCL